MRSAASASNASASPRVATPAYSRSCDSAADPLVEPDGRPPGSGDDVLCETRRLLRHRGSQLGARGDAPQRPLHLVAGEYPVGDLDGLRAGERLRHQPLELTARSELPRHTLQDVVPDERASELLRERPGQRSVQDARHLGRIEDVLRRRLDPSAPGSCRAPSGIERGAPRRVGDAPPLAVFGHGLSIARQPSVSVGSPRELQTRIVCARRRRERRASCCSQRITRFSM